MPRTIDSKLPEGLEIIGDSVYVGKRSAGDRVAEYLSNALRKIDNLLLDAFMYW